MTLCFGFWFICLFAYSLLLHGGKHFKENNFSPSRWKGYHFIHDDEEAGGPSRIGFFVKCLTCNVHIKRACFLISTWFSHYFICGTLKLDVFFHSFHKNLKLFSMKSCWCEMCVFSLSCAFSWAQIEIMICGKVFEAAENKWKSWHPAIESEREENFMKWQNNDLRFSEFISGWVFLYFVPQSDDNFFVHKKESLNWK